MDLYLNIVILYGISQKGFAKLASDKAVSHLLRLARVGCTMPSRTSAQVAFADEKSW